MGWGVGGGWIGSHNDPVIERASREGRGLLPQPGEPPLPETVESLLRFPDSAQGERGVSGGRACRKRRKGGEGCGEWKG